MDNSGKDNEQSGRAGRAYACFTPKDTPPTHMPLAPHMEPGGRRAGPVQLDHRVPGRGRGWSGGKSVSYENMVLLVCCYGGPHPWAPGYEFMGD